MIYITNIRTEPSNARKYDRIVEVKWQNPNDGQVGTNTVQELVDWIDNKNGVAKVTDGKHTVDVVVVHSQPPYLRTVADGSYTDNLLALPPF